MRPTCSTKNKYLGRNACLIAPYVPPTEMQGRSKLQEADAEGKEVGLKNIVIRSSVKVYSMS